MKYIQAFRSDKYGSCWCVTPNDIWNIPDNVGEIRFEYERLDTFHRPIVSISGLAMTLSGKIFGMRKMHHPKESGYNLEGRVSISGKKYRAFTSSSMFEREDKSLINVAVLVVCGFD